MKKKETRTYNSIVRQKQAEETKNRIADSAEELIKANGYEYTTIGEIAGKAGVATQTVYSIFNSKQGILVYLLKRSLQNMEVKADYKSLLGYNDKESLANNMASMLSREGREHMTIFNALGGLDKLYPELAELMHEANGKRRQSLFETLQEATKRQNIELNAEQQKILTDIFWALTDTSLYYMLVEECRWPHDYFELFLKQIIMAVMKDIAPNMVKLSGK